VYHTMAKDTEGGAYIYIHTYVYIYIIMKDNHSKKHGRESKDDCFFSRRIKKIRKAKSLGFIKPKWRSRPAQLFSLPNRLINSTFEDNEGLVLLFYCNIFY